MSLRRDIAISVTLWIAVATVCVVLPPFGWMLAVASGLSTSILLDILLNQAEQSKQNTDSSGVL